MNSVNLLCTVRSCGAVLRRDGRICSCEHGHTFDVSRHGYINLLQPQDRRSKHPGDSREAAAARRRVFDAGYGAFFVEALLEALDGFGFEGNARILDVGCGEGYHLGALAAARTIEADGVDISVPAIDLAARTWPGARWVVANADRTLPYESGSFDLVLSITSRRNEAEFHRVLKPGGKLLVAVPGEDDLIEPREAVLGQALRRNRMAATSGAFSRLFALERHTAAAHRARLPADWVRDLLESTYRGMRSSQRERFDRLGAMDVTMSREVMVFGRR